MRRILSLLCPLVLLFSGCVQEELQTNESASLDGRIFTASFEQDQTRTYLEDGNLLRWNAGDQISLFDGNTLNRQYQFDGETGDNSGTFSIVDKPYGTGNALNANCAVYPYASDVKISEGGVITAMLPSVQNYAENSFGLGANTMVAVTKDVDDTFLKFKNTCGYLKLQLYGEDVTVKSITLTGNNNEKIAGKASITYTYAQEPTIDVNDDATTSITLDCGDGVNIGTTAETATAFWVVVPPTTFEEGFEIIITDVNGKIFTKSTSNAINIERNTIQPMAAFKVEILKIPNNQIWYTSSNGKIVTPYDSSVFGATILSNTYIDGKGVIEFNRDITSIGKKAFYLCSTLTSIDIPNNVTEIGQTVFYYCSSLKRVTIGNGVTSIGNGAFGGCSALTSINIPNSVVKIGEWAFSNCNMTRVTIPNSVTEIGKYAFRHCESLTSFYGKFASEDNRCLIVNGVLNSFASAGLTSYSIPNSVTEIGEMAFVGCSTLTSVTVPNSVTEIGMEAFRGCKALTSFHGEFASEDNRCLIIDGVLKAFAYAGLTTYTIPNGVTEIGNYTFYSCSVLNSVNMPNSVTDIGDLAFNGCSSLTSVSIPKNVVSIGDYAFSNCSALKTVYCKPTTPPTSDFWGGMFDKNASSRKIYVPTESVNAYKTAKYWSDYASYIEGCDF